MILTFSRISAACGICVFGMTLAYAQSAPSGTAQTPTPAASAPTSALAAPQAAPTALKLVDRVVGTGATAEAGRPVLVHYSGYLWDATKPDNKGEMFDSSTSKPIPFGFMLGRGRVIAGWEEGVVGMKVGGQRTLIIPADKGYGAAGSAPKIPPNAALIFDIELMGVIGQTPNPKPEASEYVPLKAEAKK